MTCNPNSTIHYWCTSSNTTGGPVAPLPGQPCMCGAVRYDEEKQSSYVPVATIPPDVYLTQELTGASADTVYAMLGGVLSLMKDAKPNDRSEVDRYWAISITDMEKLVAVFEKYVVGNIRKAG